MYHETTAVICGFWSEYLLWMKSRVYLYYRKNALVFYIKPSKCCIMTGLWSATIGNGQAPEWVEHGPLGGKVFIRTGTHETRVVSTLINMYLYWIDSDLFHITSLSLIIKFFTITFYIYFECKCSNIGGWVGG